MTGYVYLEKIGVLKYKRLVAVNELKEVESDIVYIRAVDYTKEKITCTATSDLCLIVEKHEEKRRKIVGRIERIDELVEEARNRIWGIDNQEYAGLLIDRYINGESAKTISGRMKRGSRNSGKSSVYRELRRAIREFDETYRAWLGELDDDLTSF